MFCSLSFPLLPILWSYSSSVREECFSRNHSLIHRREDGETPPTHSAGQNLHTYVHSKLTHKDPQTLIVLALATMTRYQRLDGLNSKHVCLSVLQASKSTIRAIAWSGCGEGPSAVWILKWQREKEPVYSSAYRETNPIMSASPS